MTVGREALAQVAALHAAAIDRGFLSSLGPRFLVQLYRAIDEAPGGVLLVEQREGRVAGFIAGSTAMGPVRRQLLRHPLPLVVALAPALLRPRTILGIGEAARGAGNGDAGLPRAELLSLAVEPRFRGSGIAESLYLRLVDRLRALGADAFRIVVGEALAPAHRFYQRMGAVPVARVQVHRGNESIVYTQQIPRRS